MTANQRAALKLALEYMTAAMRPLAFDANVAMQDPNAPPAMRLRLKRYTKLAADMQTIEEMIQGVQGELPL